MISGLVLVNGFLDFFRRHLPAIILFVTATTAFGQLPTSFQKVEIVTGLKNSINFEFAPDGRIFILDRFGEIIIYKIATQTRVSAGVLDVFHDMEDGLLAVAFDPDFLTNNFLYIHYSHPTLPNNRVSRFQMNGDELVLSSEVVLLEWTSDRNGYYHAAGDMDFDSQGNLYIGIGDNSNHTAYAALNESDRNQSAERTSSNTNDLRGKILRIKPQLDGTYTIPSGNLFPGGVGGRPEIYVMGARNPFKIFVDKTNTDWLFWAEVGPDANFESDKGPEGMDEINLVKNAGNYGWPYVSGKNEPYLNTYAQPNFYYDHSAPVNLSKWNTGSQALPPAQPSWLEFYHGCYLAGPRYYYDASIINPKKLPSDFHQKFFYLDFNTSKIWVVTMGQSGNVLSNQRFAENVITGLGFIDMKISPDGQLYILEYGAGCCQSSVGSGKLVRIDYLGIDANKSPEVTLTSNVLSGPLPLTVDFSSAGTTDPDGDALMYEWDFDSDGSIDSNLPNPSFTYTEAGTFSALLRVRDSRDAITAETILIYPGNSAPSITFNSPPDGGLMAWEDRIQYEIVVTDSEDGSTSDGSINCENVNFIPAFGHLTHSHDGLTVNQCSGTFDLDPTSHDAQGEDDIYYVLRANYTDSHGLTSFNEVTVHPKVMEAEFFDGQNNTKLVENADVLGGARYAVRGLSNNSYIMLSGRNLININSVSYRLASTVGGVIEVHADAPDGPLLSTATIPVTGALNRWAYASAPIINPTGKHDLYFVFKKPGSINIVDLNYIEFIGPGVSIDITPPNIYSLRAASKRHVILRFNEALQPLSAEDKTNYFISNGVAILSATLQEDKRTVDLYTSPLTVGIEYDITINGVRNQSGVAINGGIIKSFALNDAFIRINSGGPMLNLQGTRWEASQSNNGGSIGSKILPINNTTDDVLYHTELVGDFTYNIPLPDQGLYNVKLHFAELAYNGVGLRVFNVNIEDGQRSLMNYDIVAKAGFATALVEHVDGILVNDGFLNVSFKGVTRNAKVCAIEVYYADAPVTPAISILNPDENLMVSQPFDLHFNVENWWMAPGGPRVHKIVDGVKVGDVYTTDPITFDNLSPGPHVIQLTLADESGQVMSVADAVQITVAQPGACIDNPFPLAWEQYVIGSDLPYRSPHITAVDIDQDGYKDIVTGAWWFKNPKNPKGVWSRNIIGAVMNNMFLAYDFDNDGDVDILGTKGTYLSSQLAWAQNDGRGNFTIHTNIPQAAGFPIGSTNDTNTFLSGVAVGNFNAVDNIQIALVWNGSETTKAPVKMLTVPSDPVSQMWTVNDIAPNAVGESITAQDIDGDGDLDLCQAKNWLRNDGGSWTTISTGITMATYYEHHQFGDFDRDGALEGAMTQIGENQPIISFKVPANPTQPWIKNTLGTDVDAGLSLDIVDLDFDGDLDVITGEWKVEKRLIAFENDLCNTGTWIKHVLHPGGTSAPDHHNATKAADLDNDGDFDIVSVGWDKRTPRIYINNSSTIGDNAAPAVANEIPDQNATPGTAFSYAFPDNTFSDADGDLLTYNAALINGNALPSWLTFTSSTRTFSGTPPVYGVATLQIRVTANDSKGGSSSDVFSLIFPNLAPVVGSPIPDQDVLSGSTISFTFAAGTFVDPNGDALTYTAKLSGGSSLPPWLTFSATTRTFTSNAAASDVGIYEIMVTASDNALSVNDLFNYKIIDPAINQPPTVANPLVDQNAVIGTLFTFPVPANTFHDANGTPLVYTALLSDDSPLPGWLSFTPATMTFSGTPGSADAGSFQVKVIANDGTDAAIAPFTLTVEMPGSIRLNSGGPVLTVNGLLFSKDQYFTGGGSYTNNNIADIAGTTADQLYKSERNNACSYNVPLPSGNYTIKLHFAEIYFGATGGSTGGIGKRIFNVTAEGQTLLTNFDIYAEVGAMRALIKQFEVLVTDGTLNISLVKVLQNPKISAVEIIPASASTNEPPVLANPIANQIIPSSAPWTFAIAANAFVDPDGDVLSYSAQLSNGSPLPAWLSFNSITRTFTGTPTVADVGVINVRVTASDGVESSSATFSITVQEPSQNQQPVLANPIPDQLSVAGTEFNFTLVSNAFTDADGDVLTYSASLSGGTALPAWLSFNSSTRTFSGTPGILDEGPVQVLVTASDATSSASDVFVITVQLPVVNQPPIVNSAIVAPSVNAGNLFTFAFSATAFIDPDSDPLSYTAGLESGGSLPPWLSFNGTSRTFSGTPDEADVGEILVKVTASDGTEDISQAFPLTVLASDAIAIRINSGGPAMTAYEATFDQDNRFSGGRVYANNKIADIAGTSYDALYKTERNNIFSYIVPVVSGTYLVKLHFAEIYFGATGGGVGGVGKRIFNVSAEGQPLLTNFDIFAEVGSMTALVKQFIVTVTDGTMNLNFIKVVDNPKVNAVEILSATAGSNQPPFIANPIADQVASSGEFFALTFPANTFADPDNDVLTYTSTAAGGAPLPSWLNFSPQSLTFSGTPEHDDEGSLHIGLHASDGNGGSVTETFTLTILSNANEQADIRINAGGSSFTTTGGLLFASDFGYSGGGIYTNSNVTDIAGTTDDFIYRTERYKMSGYNIPVIPGTYRLRLHFAEIYFGATGGGAGGSGKRVFNVLAEGSPLLTNFDVYAEVGAMTAVVKEFEVTVSDGILNIAFVRIVENPKVNAIEIIAVNSGARISSSGRTSVEGQPPQGFDETHELIAYPNPFEVTTTLEYTPSTDGHISLQVYNVGGSLMKNLFEGEVKQGTMYRFELNGSGLPSGLYFARLTKNGRTRFLKLALSNRP